MSDAPDSFVRTLETALDHFPDEDWLGQQSPLAAPYFIAGQKQEGQAALSSGSAARVRGRVLKQTLIVAAENLRPDQQKLLKAAFFERNPNHSNHRIARDLGYSESSYYRHRNVAVEHLARALGSLVIPPLRPEHPRSNRLVGRTEIISACLSALHDRKTVALTGTTGMGKTTLAVEVAQQWGQQRVFWITIRPGLNDQLSSVVFALAHFLRAGGASRAWQQLIADRGEVHVDRIRGLLFQDIKDLEFTHPLLCFDEIHVLRREIHEHLQLLHFIESVSQYEHAPAMLLIGQQVVSQIDQHYLLTEFSDEEIDRFFAQSGLSQFSLAERAELVQVTQGNPSLLTLLSTLVLSGEAVLTLVRQQKGPLSIEKLLDVAWLHFDQQERGVLSQLAVFQQAAPSDVWRDSRDVIERLITRNMLQDDALGGLFAPQSVREFIVRHTPPDELLSLHLAAAEIYESRGEYTNAIYHYIEAHQPASAVYLWLAHHAEEKERGHSARAYQMIKGIAYSDLSHESDRHALSMVRNMLAEVLGNADDAAQSLNKSNPPSGSPLQPYWYDQKGKALERQGRIYDALDQYRRGLATFDEPLAFRHIHLHQRMGELFVNRLVDLEKAWRQAQTARFNTEMFCGDVQEKRGAYTKAISYFQAALELVGELEDPKAARARAYSCIGRTYWMNNQPDQAIVYLTDAITVFREQGAVFRVLNDQINLSSAYIIAGRHIEAQATALAGLSVARTLGHPDLLAGLASNCGEACVGIGLLDEAEAFATESLLQEESVWQPYATIVIGMVHHKRANLDKAEMTFKAAITAAQQAQEIYAEIQAWRLLAEVYVSQNNHEAEKEARLRIEQVSHSQGN